VILDIGGVPTITFEATLTTPIIAADRFLSDPGELQRRYEFQLNDGQQRFAERRELDLDERHVVRRESDGQ